MGKVCDEVWIHNKTGGRYVIVDLSEFQCSSHPVFDGWKMVTYTPLNQPMVRYTRLIREFEAKFTKET